MSAEGADREPAPRPTPSRPLGGRAGRRLRPRAAGPLAPLAPVVLLLALPLAAAVLRQTACLSTGWAGRTPLWRQCASPLVADVTGADLGRGLLAYLSGSVRVDEPVVTGAVHALLAGLAPGEALVQQRWFLALWVLLAAVVLPALVVAVGTTGRHPAADPAVFALSPVLALTVLLAPTLVPVALATGAVRAWSRDRTRVAGVLAGLSVLGGLPAVVVLLALLVVPGPGGREAARRLLVAALGTVAGVVAVVALLDPRTLTGPVVAWFEEGSGPGSLLYLATLARHPVGAGQVALVAVLGLALAAVLTVLAARRPRPSVGAVAVVGLVALLATGPSLAPAAALWVLPFAALAGLRWRDHLLWAGAEAVHGIALYAHLAAATDTAKGIPPGWYAIALAVRVGALVWVARQAWTATSWEQALPAGTLARLPSRRPVENHGGAVGSAAYPPVTEGP
ncbi:hypothetical protein [Oryzobacter terrae]|uniref:hypothetical protein n=1 Tax=Oryzobacter terrae TaxID=1620385 RepID=UPI00366EDD5C